MRNAVIVGLLVVVILLLALNLMNGRSVNITVGPVATVDPLETYDPPLRTRLNDAYKQRDAIGTLVGR